MSKVIPIDTVPSVVDKRQHRIKTISIALGISLFILSLAFPLHIVMKIVQNPVNMIVKKNITNNIPKNIVIYNPSLTQYVQLYSKYPQTLQCPCSQTSIQHSRFIEISNTFHQICSSIFVSDEWIDYLANIYVTLFTDDFRMTSSYTFQTLRTLCVLGNKTFEQNLMKFLSDEFVSLKVIPAILFQSIMQIRVEQFRSSMLNSFQLSFSMIRETIQDNALFSSLQTNYRLMTQDNQVFSVSQNYSECLCSFSSKCIRQSMIYQYPSGHALFSVPGFYTGCYIIESLLQSDLRCFYNEICINELVSYFPLLVNVTALDSSLPSRYRIDSTVDAMLQNLMIEEFNVTIKYDSYYQECRPEFCSYTIETSETVESVEIVQAKTDIASMVGLVIGIIGGIITILQLIITRFVKFIVGTI